MGVSLLTALIIQANPTEVAVYKKGGGYGFELYSLIREKHRPQITSNPRYTSSSEAIEKGKKLLEGIKSLNLDEERKGLSKILGDEAPVISQVIEASNNLS
jgi:hypothetical protein